MISKLRLLKNLPRRTTARQRGFVWLETLLTLSVLSLVIQLLWPSLEVWWNRPIAGRQVAARFEGEVGSFGYLLYLPEDYDESEQRWPLLLFLHGAGKRGHNLEKVRGCGPPLLIDSGKPLSMIVVSPQCPKNIGWQPELLKELLDEMSKRFSVNPRQVFVTGHSMGAYGTWALAASDPERFAAAAPICGGGDVNQADRLAKVPIWAFHGGKDETIPPKASQEMVDAIQALGGNAKLTIYPDEGHNSTSRLVYHEGQLYEWLLTQHRPTMESTDTLEKTSGQVIADGPSPKDDGRKNDP